MTQHNFTALQPSRTLGRLDRVGSRAVGPVASMRARAQGSGWVRGWLVRSAGVSDQAGRAGSRVAPVCRPGPIGSAVAVIELGLSPDGVGDTSLQRSECSFAALAVGLLAAVSRRGPITGPTPCSSVSVVPDAACVVHRRSVVSVSEGDGPAFVGDVAGGVGDAVDFEAVGVQQCDRTTAVAQLDVGVERDRECRAGGELEVWRRGRNVSSGRPGASHRGRSGSGMR